MISPSGPEGRYPVFEAVVCSWKPPLEASHPPNQLTVVLRPYTEADVGPFYDGLDANRSRLVLLGVTATRPQLDDIAPTILDSQSGIRGGVYLIDGGHERFVGHVHCKPINEQQYSNFPPAHRQTQPAAEISYWRIFGPELKGVMDEPVKTMIGIAEQQREARGWGDLYALVRNANTSSQKLLGRLGYRATSRLVDRHDSAWTAYLLSSYEG